MDPQDQNGGERVRLTRSESVGVLMEMSRHVKAKEELAALNVAVKTLVHRHYDRLRNKLNRAARGITGKEAENVCV